MIETSSRALLGRISIKPHAILPIATVRLKVVFGIWSTAADATGNVSTSTNFTVDGLFVKVSVHWRVEDYNSRWITNRTFLTISNALAPVFFLILIQKALFLVACLTLFLIEPVNVTELIPLIFIETILIHYY